MQIEKFENEKWKKFWKARNKISKNFFLGGVCQKMFKQIFFFWNLKNKNVLKIFSTWCNFWRSWTQQNVWSAQNFFVQIGNQKRWFFVIFKVIVLKGYSSWDCGCDLFRKRTFSLRLEFKKRTTQYLILKDIRTQTFLVKINFYTDFFFFFGVCSIQLVCGKCLENWKKVRCTKVSEWMKCGMRNPEIKNNVFCFFCFKRRKIVDPFFFFGKWENSIFVSYPKLNFLKSNNLIWKICLGFVSSPKKNLES